MRDFLRPTYAEVSLEALRNNYRRLSRKYSPSEVMPVVKADAYGHGALAAAKVFEKEEAPLLGVATIEEGIELREAGISTPIIVLGSVYPFENYKEMIRYSLIPVIASLTSALALDAASSSAEKKTPYHLKIDTGMGRIGVSPDTALRIWPHLKSLKSIECEGVFTHLSCGDSDLKETEEQVERFRRVTGSIERPKYLHTANTAGFINSPASRFNLIRPGLALYGLYPEGISSAEIELEPALSWKSAVVFLKDISPGSGVSYGLTWRAEKKTKLATLCVGYADGYPRALSNTGKVLIRGEECQVVGRVCMDMIMADVGEVRNISVGDEAVLIGESGKRKISAERLASLAGTVNYEILTRISHRVPRVYV